MYRHIGVMLLAVMLVVVPTQAQTDLPHLMFFDGTGFVIQRADGSESRSFGRELMPDAGSGASGPGWSAGGEWFAWQVQAAQGMTGLLVLHADGATAALALAEAAVIRATWHPDQDRLLALLGTDGGYEAVVLDATTDQITLRIPIPGLPHQPWALDGDWIDAARFLVTFALEGAVQGFVVEAESGAAVSSAWQGPLVEVVPAQGVVAHLSEGQFYVDDLRAGRRWAFELAASQINALAWNPRHDALLVQTPTALYAVSDGAAPLVAENAQAGSWSPDGTWALFTVGTSTGVYNRLTNAAMLLQAGAAPMWLGNTIAWGEADGDGMRLVRHDPASGDRTSTTLPIAPTIMPQLSPDGRYLGAIADDTYVRDLITGNLIIIPSGGVGGQMRWHPGGAPFFIALEESDAGDRVATVRSLDGAVSRELTTCPAAASLCALWVH